MNRNLPRLTLLALASLLVLPAIASAQPQIDPETDEAGSFYATVGKDVTASSRIYDESICKDNTYDSDTDEEVDVNGDDYNMAGTVAYLQAQPQSGGDWANVASQTITRDDIEIECDGEDGAAYAEVELAAKAGDVRANYRVAYRGGTDNVELNGKDNLMFPRFPENWRWKNARNGRSTTLTLKTDPRLIGVKAIFFLSAGPKYKTWKPTKKVVIKKKGSQGYLKMTQKLPAKSKKRGWRGYVCLDYQPKYPLMNTGNACPTKTVTATRLEELFPYSTLGPR